MQVIVKKYSELNTEELYSIMELRVAVFVVEQNCPYLEIDGLDRDAVHVWLEEDGKILAYLRVMDRGVESEYVSIGRLLAAERRKGYGTMILSEGIRVAREYFGADRIYLEAQVYARGLYEKQGFKAVSEEFLLDGIPHVKMMLECD